MEKSSKPFVEKLAFDTYSDLVLFSWRCPDFTLSVSWRNYMSSFKSCDKTILLPSVELLSNALLDYCNKGNVERLFAISCVSFHSRLCYIVGIISFSPSTTYYVEQFIKAYSKFYNNFNQNNYILK